MRKHPQALSPCPSGWGVGAGAFPEPAGLVGCSSAWNSVWVGEWQRGRSSDAGIASLFAVSQSHLSTAACFACQGEEGEWGWLHSYNCTLSSKEEEGGAT